METLKQKYFNVLLFYIFSGEILMKKILAMAAVVALTAGVSGYAANVNDNVKISGDVNVKYFNQKDRGDLRFARVRLQADADLTDEVSVSGRAAFSKNLSGDEDYKGFKKVAWDSLYVAYSPAQVEGLKLNLGRTGVAIGNDSDIKDDIILDGVVASYKKDRYSVEAGFGKVRLNEEFNGLYDAENVVDTRYIKGSFDVSDKVSVGGFYSCLNDVNFYGADVKAQIAKNVSVKGDLMKLDVSEDALFKRIGVTYGKANQKVGSWEVGINYYDIDKDFDSTKYISKLSVFIFNDFAYLWEAEGKATVYKNVTLKSFIANGKVGGSYACNYWGFELNYAF